MHRPLRLALAIATSLFVLSDLAHAGGTPGQICAGAKLKVTGKSAARRLTCHAKAARQGAAVDATCLGKAKAKLTESFAKAQARGGCITTGDSGDISDMVDSAVGAFVAALRPITSANQCAGFKLKATGKKVKIKLGCHAKATRRGLAVDASCLAKAEVRFANAFSTVEVHGPCITSGDAAGIEGQVDDLVDDVVAALPSGPSSTTTTSTIPGPACGNGVVEGSEQCDNNPEPICQSSGRSGCFPSGSANECKCCTLPGETGLVDIGGTVLNECCDGSGPVPAGPGAYFCPM